jgi:hypothetical protein
MRRVRDDQLMDEWMLERRRELVERERRRFGPLPVAPAATGHGQHSLSTKTTMRLESASTAKGRERKADLDARPHGRKLNLHAHYAIT